MQYSFYPGCSLEATAVHYLKSLEPVLEALDIQIEEIPDWNCCGATVASGVVGDFTQQAITGRNLAIAEQKGNDILVACSSCYLSLATTNKRFREDEHFRNLANEALGAAGLKYNGTLRVRQILEALINDVGLEKISKRVEKPLTGLKVAGYTGCQTPRAIPWEFEDPENPHMLDKIIEALGATLVPFPMKAKCCGSSQAVAQPDIVLDCCRDIIQCAVNNEADLIVTPCPMCQMNLDAYQGMVNQKHGTNFETPILFITQLMGIAFGLPAPKWALKYNIVSPEKVIAPLLRKLGA
ncbi:CoB--CoM heterodisulfide reductase iron-sulfur subunit B family protein [Desulfolucanica intricata]|uniref:CoB--CoM heterodisulfide reductase iron-sulfur subunit B family protein n=1 Tax=Desulfolucanica intricata TaxID=1285191 RepID=UPI00082B7B9D|nr:CoB--CoM heterodisulfide reductase iron-sulfur subunit B family protein [Desulfolucanica intricata]